MVWFFKSSFMQLKSYFLSLKHKLYDKSTSIMFSPSCAYSVFQCLPESSDVSETSCVRKMTGLTVFQPTAIYSVLKSARLWVWCLFDLYSHKNLILLTLNKLSGMGIHTNWYCDTPNSQSCRVVLMPLLAPCTSAPYLGPIKPAGWKSVSSTPPPLSHFPAPARLPGLKSLRSITPSMRGRHVERERAMPSHTPIAFPSAEMYSVFPPDWQLQGEMWHRSAAAFYKKEMCSHRDSE